MEPAAKKAKTADHLKGAVAVTFILDGGDEVPLAAESPLLKMSEMLTVMVARWSQGPGSGSGPPNNAKVNITGCNQTALSALARVCHNRATTPTALPAPTVDPFLEKPSWGGDRAANEQAEAANKVQVQALNDWQDEQDAADVKGIESFFEEEPAPGGGETSLEVLQMALTAANFLAVGDAVIDILCKTIAVAIAPAINNTENTYLAGVQATLLGTDGPPQPALGDAYNRTAPTLLEVDKHIRAVHSIEPSLLGKILRFVVGEGEVNLRGNATSPKQFWTLYHSGHKAARQEARKEAEDQAIEDSPYKYEHFEDGYWEDYHEVEIAEGKFTVGFALEGECTIIHPNTNAINSDLEYNVGIKFQIFYESPNGEQRRTKMGQDLEFCCGSTSCDWKYDRTEVIEDITKGLALKMNTLRLLTDAEIKSLADIDDDSEAGIPLHTQPQNEISYQIRKAVGRFMEDPEEKD